MQDCFHSRVHNRIGAFVQEQQLAVLIKPILVKVGLELDSTGVTLTGRWHLLCIIVDSGEPHRHGSVLDDISVASVRISVALDVSNVIGDAPYILGVTSRGVGEPPTKAEYYHRNRGRLAYLGLTEGECMECVLCVTDTGVELDVGSTKCEVSFERMRKAQVEVELNPLKKFALPGEEAGNEEEV